MTTSPLAAPRGLKLPRLLVLPLALTLFAGVGCSSAAPTAAPTPVDPSPTASDPGPTPPPATTAPGDTRVPAQTAGQQSDCSLYTLDELSAVWGVTFKTVRTNEVTWAIYDRESGTDAMCDYVEADFSGVSVLIRLVQFEGETDAVASFADERGDDYYQNTDAPGLGDEAFTAIAHDEAGASSRRFSALRARLGALVVHAEAKNLSGLPVDALDKLMHTLQLKFG